MKLTATEVVKQGKKLFEDKYPLDSLWQILAENFYPERADFTTTRNVGSEFADQLLDSWPVIARRDLGNSLNAMLRSGDWFEMTTSQPVSHSSKAWLDWASQRQMKLMKFRGTGFTKATKEGDHDFITFGQCVISVEFDTRHWGLLYRCWHLRDCAWTQDERGEVCVMYRRWRPTIHEAYRRFGEELHEEHRERMREDPFQELEFWHVFLPSELYDEEMRMPYVSLYVDVAKEEILEELPAARKMYVVPRFQTVSGSQYGHSPAVMTALPHSRLVQAITHTILEAGERYVNPPLIATQNVIRSDFNLYAGGITWTDAEYDERMGEALRPIGQDKSGFPIGNNIREGVNEMIANAFYLNKLVLPPFEGMTATEVIERTREFQRMAKPLFTPIEEEYNGQICELTFATLLSMGEFGAPDDIPDELVNTEIDFKFASPIAEAEERTRVQMFQASMGLAQVAAGLDPSVLANLDMDQGLRDAIDGSGAPASWLTDEAFVAQRKAEMQQQQAQMQQMAQAQQEAQMMATVAKARKDGGV